MEPAPTGSSQDREHIHEFRFGEARAHRQGQRCATSTSRARRRRWRSAPRRKQATDLEVYDFPGEYQVPAGGRAPTRAPAWPKIRLEATAARPPQRRRQERLPAPRARLRVHACRPPAQRAQRRLQPAARRATGASSRRCSSRTPAAASLRLRATASRASSARPPYRPPRSTPRPVGAQACSRPPWSARPARRSTSTSRAACMVQFHWDREGQFDEDAARAGSASASCGPAPGWGAMFIPRIGHEVLVDFIEGDPDHADHHRPRSTTASTSPPYPLPDAEDQEHHQVGQLARRRRLQRAALRGPARGSEQIFMHARAQHGHPRQARPDGERAAQPPPDGRHANDGGGPRSATSNENMLMRDHHWRIDRNRNEHVGGDACGSASAASTASATSSTHHRGQPPRAGDAEPEPRDRGRPSRSRSAAATTS